MAVPGSHPAASPVTRVPASTTSKRTRDPRILDAVLVAVTLMINVAGVLPMGHHNEGAGVPGPFGLLLLMIGPVALWWRRGHPTLVLAVGVTATWSYVLADQPAGPIYGPMIVALVSALTHGARLAAYVVVAGTLTVGFGQVVLPGIDGPSPGAVGALAAWLLFLLALGEALRHRVALKDARRVGLLATLDAHADQIRREAAEERFSLARDLHDVLGHQLAVINIQAKAGHQLHASNKPGVSEALEAVADTSGQAIHDIQAFLDSLHQPGEAAAHAPAPSLDDIDTLLAPARAAGLDVRIDMTGTPRRLPSPQDLVASRVITEALTNVLRHAGLVRTWVRIAYEPDRLHVRIDNAAPRSGVTHPSPGGGRGIEGMTQRLTAQGGTLKAGPTEAFAWSVEADLPLPKEHV